MQRLTVQTSPMMRKRTMERSGPTHDARFCTMCLYVYDELQGATQIVIVPCYILGRMCWASSMRSQSNLQQLKLQHQA